jgi:hypothetical protein
MRKRPFTSGSEGGFDFHRDWPGVKCTGPIERNEGKNRRGIDKTIERKKGERTKERPMYTFHHWGRENRLKILKLIVNDVSLCPLFVPPRT